jgi:hypothetical protein
MRLGTAGSAEQAATGCCFRAESERVVGRGIDDRSGRGAVVSLAAGLLPARRQERASQPQGQVAAVELAGDSDFLAPFWRIGVIERAC